MRELGRLQLTVVCSCDTRALSLNVNPGSASSVHRPFFIFPSFFSSLHSLPPYVYLETPFHIPLPHAPRHSWFRYQPSIRLFRCCTPHNRSRPLDFPIFRDTWFCICTVHACPPLHFIPHFHHTLGSGALHHHSNISSSCLAFLSRTCR